MNIIVDNAVFNILIFLSLTFIFFFNHTYPIPVTTKFEIKFEMAAPFIPPKKYLMELVLHLV